MALIHAIAFFGQWLAPWVYIGLGAFALRAARKTLANEAKNSSEIFSILEAMQKNDDGWAEILSSHTDSITTAVAAIQQLQAAEVQMKEVVIVHSFALLRAGILVDPQEFRRTVH